MRLDKLTTKFQQALADAQSMALGNDSGFIEPQHLLAALLAQEDGGTASLLARAGVNVPALKTTLGKAITRLPTTRARRVVCSRNTGSRARLSRRRSKRSAAVQAWTRKMLKDSARR